MTTLRRVLVLLALTILAAVAAGLSVLDLFNLRNAQWFTAGTVLLTLVLATITLTVAVKVFLARVLVLVLGGIATLGWAVTAWLAIGIGDPGRPVAEVVSGDRRLVMLEGAAFAVDPVFRVVLRSGSGVFEQESLAWEGVQGDAGPSDMAFRGTDEIEIRSGPCTFVSRVEPVTLEIAPVHRSTDTC